ncbi:hypothetical protein HD597_003944 [Nonomuraea thailandensis]|uniref:Uncharacterized protein n=1 Tax=Nonomuraea thailandensis TaxID=1188745 RepID=A0A9X2GD41_9ACTN|nr:hypothetical protein [Nonomuraea thailandensis]
MERFVLRVAARCRGSARHRRRADVLRTSDGLRTAPSSAPSRPPDVTPASLGASWQGECGI